MAEWSSYNSLNLELLTVGCIFLFAFSSPKTHFVYSICQKFAKLAIGCENSMEKMMIK
jgi:hypothetical protein